MRQAWVLCGVVLIGLGAFLSADPGGRLQVLGEATLRWLPLFVLALAALNALIAALPDGAWIAPAALGAIGGSGLLLRSPETLPGGQGLLPAAVLSLGAVALVRGLAGQVNGSAAAVLISRHADMNGQIGPDVVAWALLAELRVDLTEATWDDVSTLHVNVVMGRVRLRVPPTTPLVLVDGGTAVTLRESGARSPSGTEVTFKIGGVFGRVDIVRE